MSHFKAHSLTIAVIFLFVAISAPLWGLEIPPKPSGYVSDYAGMLSPGFRERLEATLRQFDTETSSQILVAIFPSLENSSLEDFSIRLAAAWKPGQKEKDNGVILLVFRDDHQIRIETGYGLEGALPDALAGQIISQAIVPHFRGNNYDNGIWNGVQAVMQAIRGEYSSLEKHGDELTEAEIRRLGLRIKNAVKIVLAAVFVIFMIDLVRYRTYRHDRKNYAGRYSFWGWWFRFALLLFLLNIIFRIIFYALLYSRGGGYYGSRGGFGGSSGGFSGGGGSFGGGGASGRW